MLCHLQRHRPRCRRRPSRILPSQLSSRRVSLLYSCHPPIQTHTRFIHLELQIDDVPTMNNAEAENLGNGKQCPLISLVLFLTTRSLFRSPPPASIRISRSSVARFVAFDSPMCSLIVSYVFVASDSPHAFPRHPPCPIAVFACPKASSVRNRPFFPS